MSQSLIPKPENAVPYHLKYKDFNDIIEYRFISENTELQFRDKDGNILEEAVLKDPDGHFYLVCHGTATLGKNGEEPTEQDFDLYRMFDSVKDLLNFVQPYASEETESSETQDVWEEVVETSYPNDTTEKILDWTLETYNRANTEKILELQDARDVLFTGQCNYYFNEEGKKVPAIYVEGTTWVADLPNLTTTQSSENDYVPFLGNSSPIQAIKGKMDNLVDGTSIFAGADSLETTCSNEFAQLTVAHAMFEGCLALSTISMSGAFPAVNTATRMFNNSGLRSISNCFNNVTAAQNMFQGCDRLTSCTSTFDALESGSQMFMNCESLKSITATQFPSLKNGSAMFNGCSSLSSITGDSWDTVTNASSMFRGCKSLKGYSLGMNSLETATQMFYGCSSLENVSMDGSNITSTYQMFQDCASLTNVTFAKLTPNSYGGMFHNAGKERIEAGEKNILTLVIGNTTFAFIEGLDNNDAERITSLTFNAEGDTEVTTNYSDKFQQMFKRFRNLRHLGCNFPAAPTQELDFDTLTLTMGIKNEEGQYELITDFEGWVNNEGVETDVSVVFPHPGSSFEGLFQTAHITDFEVTIPQPPKKPETEEGKEEKEEEKFDTTMPFDHVDDCRNTFLNSLFTPESVKVLWDALPTLNDMDGNHYITLGINCTPTEFHNGETAYTEYCGDYTFWNGDSETGAPSVFSSVSSAGITLEWGIESVPRENEDNIEPEGATATFFTLDDSNNTNGMLMSNTTPILTKDDESYTADFGKFSVVKYTGMVEEYDPVAQMTFKYRKEINPVDGSSKWWNATPDPRKIYLRLSLTHKHIPDWTKSEHEGGVYNHWTVSQEPKAGDTIIYSGPLSEYDLPDLKYDKVYSYYITYCPDTPPTQVVHDSKVTNTSYDPKGNLIIATEDGELFNELVPSDTQTNYCFNVGGLTESKDDPENPPFPHYPTKNDRFQEKGWTLDLRCNKTEEQP